MGRAAWEHFVRAAARTPETIPSTDAAPLDRAGRQQGSRAARGTNKPALVRRNPARDLRLLPAAAAAWVTAALVIRLDAQGALQLGGLLAACTLACITAAVWSRRSRPVVQVLLIVLGVSAMVCLPAAAYIEQRSSAPLASAISAEAHVTVKLRAAADPRRATASGLDGSPRWLLEAELLEATSAGSRFTANTPVVILGSEEWSSVAHGDVVRSAGKPLATEPGSRAAALLIASTGPAPVAQESERVSLVERLRERFLALASATAVPDDGLMPGMVIGARSSVSRDLADTMKATGLTHLTAVSGANCSYVLAFVFVLCRGCKLPRWAAGVAGVAALVGFVLLVRPEPSVLRAAVMGAIGVLAVLTGRGRLSMTLLFLSIAALLAADPWLSVEYAFILSVTATSGLVLAGPLLAARLGAVVPLWAAQLIAVPLAAQLFCSPVLALLQPHLPTYALPANIAASPLVPFITIAGMVSVVLVALAPWVAAPSAVAAGWAAVGVAQIARFFASAPVASIPWPTGAGGVILSALGSAAVLVAVVCGPKLIAGTRDVLRGMLDERAGRQTGGALHIGRAERARRPAQTALPEVLRRAVPWVAVGCVLGGAALWMGSGLRGGGTERWTVAACNVGQGDGLAVRTGPRSAMVVDAGPDPSLMDACLDRLGVDTVDLLVLTHLHEDHYGGVSGVFENRSVLRLLYSTTEESLPTAVAEMAAAAGITGEEARAGATGSAGSVDWSVLWPHPGPVAGSENNASAVLLVTVAGEGGTPGIDVLFTGDLEEDAADRFLADHADLAAAGVDILKVAHHGARNGGARIIERLSPHIAIISAGDRNDYGHPHPETLDTLEKAGVYVARTDLHGTVLLTLEGTAMHVRSSR